MSEEYTGKVAAVVIPKTSEEKEFLLAKRSDNGDWEFPGGKQHADESIEETGEREIQEEFNIEISAERARPEYSWKGGGYDIIPVYATHEYDNLNKILDDDEMTDHSTHEFIRPEKLGFNLEDAEEKLSKEIKALEAFNLL